MQNWGSGLFFLFSYLLSSSALGQVTLFKVGQPPLGHCTAFQMQNSSMVLSAGHCNKPGDTPILQADGRLLQILPEQDKSYFVHPMGVVDAMILGLRNSDERVDSDSLLYKIESDDTGEGTDFFIIGYPEMLRDSDEPVQLRCQPIEVESGFHVQAVEKSLGTLHLKCPDYKFQGKVFSTQGVRHRDLAGLSGSPVLYKGQLMGVAYHFDEVQNLFKVQILNSQLNVQAAQSVQRRYQLHRRLFEEVKVPNTVNIHLDQLLWSNGLQLLQRDQIQEIRLFEQRLIIFFKDGEVFESQQSLTSIQMRYIQFVQTTPERQSLIEASDKISRFDL